MTTQRKNKTTIVREHPRRVPVSKKNPTGVTIVDLHPRLIEGSYLNREEIEKIFKNYNRKGLKYPASDKLKFPNGNKYDELIAVWVDYFNKKFNAEPPLDPDVIKALIASESGFREHTPENKIAFGIAQITNETFNILQDPTGESKDFLFSKIRKKDLKDPAINIPMGVRWIFHKKKLAQSYLKRSPTHEEIILQYKGLLKSKTSYKNQALENYWDNYNDLKAYK